MQLINICVFLLCTFGFVCVLNAQRYGYNNNYYQASNVGRFRGNSFGEGVLRPGSDTGEGIFSERDAPGFSVPNANSRYG